MLTDIRAIQIYRNNDKPLYRTGNKVLIALSVYSFFLFIVAKIYYDWKNRYDIIRATCRFPSINNLLFVRTRAAKWNAMTTEERDAYLAANKDSGNKRCVFTLFLCIFNQSYV